MVKVAVIDSGARGRALIDAYAKSAFNYDKEFHGLIIGSNCSRQEHRIEVTDSKKILKKLKEFEPDLVDVAQDDALASGLADILANEGYKTFGPTKKASRIEWDKKWAREFMKRHDVPAPKYMSFEITQQRGAREYAMSIIEQGKTAFVKASGLDFGKGVIPAPNARALSNALSEMKNKGKAAKVFLIEEGLKGQEFSYFVITDGKNFKHFKSAEDNKILYNGDIELMTGGVGAHSPALVTKGLEKRIAEEIIDPTIQGLRKEGINYKGILYLGGILTPEKEIKVIEFNARWGDPECLVILPGIKTNYIDLVLKTIDGKLSGTRLVEDALSRVAIVGVSNGYPGKYKLGQRIYLDYSGFPKDVDFIKAAVITEYHEGEKMYSNGGRLFSVVAKDKDLVVAREKALRAMLHFSIANNGLNYRRDVAEKDIRRLRTKS